MNVWIQRQCSAWAFRCIFAALMMFAGDWVQAGGAEVVVVYNSNLPASREVAEYYAAQRDVPKNQLIGLALSDSQTNRIDRPAFLKKMVEPLIRELSERKLVRFQSEVRPASNNVASRVVYSVSQSKIRYLLLCYGLPYFIPPDPNINPFRDEGIATNTPPEMVRNQASVDAELVLLPVFGRAPYSGAFSNPAYGETNTDSLHPTNGIMLVSRLDGPTPELAKGLVDKARVAERDGLNGRAYFDLRGIKSGNYKLGDDWIGRAAEVAEAIGFETYVDHEEATLRVGFPLSEVALYAGWYSMQVTGPFTLPTVEFMPGAIAYHLYSFSAVNPRDAKNCWVGALIAKGAAVTMGCVDEPYLAITPDIGVFLERLALQRMTVGEAGVACQPGLSWQTVVIGDPLYKPLGRHPFELEEWFKLHPNPLMAWALERKVNLYLRMGRDRDILQRYLLEQPLATNGPVLSEKIAVMAAQRENWEEAAKWARVALLHGATPQQRVRLYREIAEWQRTSDPLSALAALEEFVSEFPDHPDLPAVLREQLGLATKVGRVEMITRLTEKILQLNSQTNAPKTSSR
jgi:uncharacterized protein (TIGR03790 family)